MTSPLINEIFKIGAILVVISGIIGAFWGGFKNRKSTDNSDTAEVISIKDSTISTLRGEVDELKKKVDQYGKEIKDLQDINSAYMKLFQGNPSTLEKYMKDTAESMSQLAIAMGTVLELLKQKPTNITINK